MADVKFTDNSDEAISEMNEAVRAALEAIGQQAVTHARQNVEAAGRVKTGAAGLMGSISHEVVGSEEAVYIGTNLEYAAYHELGTGKFADNGGRPGWWVYVPGSPGGGKNSGKIYSYEEAKRIMAILQSQGIDAHMTEGIRPIHFLRNAVQDHIDEYKAISEQVIKSHQ